VKGLATLLGKTRDLPIDLQISPGRWIMIVDRSVSGGVA